MLRLKTWKALKSTIIINHPPWIKIVKDTALVGNQEFDYYFTKRIDAGTGVLPITKSGNIILVCQYRHPNRHLIWAISIPIQAVLISAPKSMSLPIYPKSLIIIAAVQTKPNNLKSEASPSPNSKPLSSKANSPTPGPSLSPVFIHKPKNSLSLSHLLSPRQTLSTICIPLTQKNFIRIITIY